MERAHHGALAIVAGMWAAWLLLAVPFALLLVLAHREVRVEPLFISVSGCLDRRDSTNGVAHWQWDPPGTSCVIAKSSEIDHREAFNRPRAWRWIVIATLAITLPLIVGVTVRTARRDDTQFVT